MKSITGLHSIVIFLVIKILTSTHQDFFFLMPVFISAHLRYEYLHVSILAFVLTGKKIILSAPY